MLLSFSFFRPWVLGLLGGLFTHSFATAVEEPMLVKNINNATPSPSGAGLWNAVSLGEDRAVLLLDDKQHGSELWVTDDTAQGTRLLKDLRPGIAGAAIPELFLTGNKAYFSADDGKHGPELWVTDGTAEGTQMVGDRVSQPGEGGNPRSIHVFKNGVIYIAESDHQPTSLWFSDATEGTILLKTSIHRAGDFSENPVIHSHAVLGDHFYFVVGGDMNPSQLWKTDGTAKGTVLVKKFGGTSGTDPTLLGSLGDTLFLRVFTTRNGAELWTSNGTAAGTVLFKDLAPGSLSSVPQQFAVLGNKAFFLSYREDPSTSERKDVWITDGTRAGTVPLRSHSFVNPLPQADFTGLKVVNQSLLMRYEGTAQGIWTYYLRDGTQPYIEPLYNSLDDGTTSYLSQWASSETVNFFISTLHSQRDRLRITDGSLGGTRAVADDFESSSRYIRNLNVAGSKAYFIAKKNGQASLWSSDGTEAGTRELHAFPSHDAGSNPLGLRVVGDQLYFSADDGVHGRELWKSNGTEAGTLLANDIVPGSEGSNPEGMTGINGHVFFASRDSRELSWLDDEGQLFRRQEVLTDQRPGAPARFYPFSNRLYFFARANPTANLNLWATDLPWQNGAASLYANLSNVSPGDGTTDRMPGDFTEMDGWLYFSAKNTVGQYSLFRTNGQPESTPTLVPSQEGSGISQTPRNVQHLFVRPPHPGSAVEPDKHVLYYFGIKESQPPLLFRCSNNGVSVQVHPRFVPGQYTNYSVGAIHPCAEQIVFTVFESNGPKGTLWCSDGTEAGTRPLPLGGNVTLLATVGDLIYFINHAQSLQLECVRADGSGRVVLMSQPRDPLAQISTPLLTRLCVEGDTLFFSQKSSLASNTSTIWQTQGTPESTWAIPHSSRTDSPNQSSDADTRVQVLHDRLYFAADDLFTRRELYALSLEGRLEVSEEQVDSARAIHTGDTVDLGLQVLGQPITRTLRLRNAGQRPIQNLALSSPSYPDFQISSTDLGMLAPGATLEIQVTFTPTATGQQLRTLNLSGTTTSGQLTRVLTFSGSGLATDAAPVFSPGPVPVIAKIGQTVTLRAALVSPQPVTSYAWHRDGVLVGTQETLHLPAVTAAAAGLYTLTVTSPTGESISPQIPVAILTPPPAMASFLAGETVTLNCTVAAPPSAALHYSWLKNGQPLIGHEGASGPAVPSLQVYAQPWDAGNYECVVSFRPTAGPPISLSHGITQLIFLNRPVVVVPPEQGFANYVGESVSYQFQADQPADRFVIKGLPPGLKASPTGVVTGRPTKAMPYDALNAGIPYRVTVTAINRGGAGPEVALYWDIYSLLPSGTYDGLFDRNAALDNGKGLGSKLSFTITSAGSFSGQLQHGGKTYRFANPTLTQTTWPGGDYHAEIHISRGALVPKLIVKMHNFEISLHDTLGNEAEGKLKQQLSVADVNNLRPAGYYTCSLLSPEEATPRVPHGNGYMVITVAKNGRVSWKGKLADGTAITGSSGVSGNMSFPVHVDLYKTTGSLHGWVEIGWRVQAPAGPLSGTLSWDKASSKDRLYSTGIALHTLAITGDQYQRPDKGQILLGLPAENDNADVTLAGLNLAEMTQSITVTAANKVLPLTVTAATPVKTLTLNPLTGTFKGTLLFPHATDPKLNRTATLEGVILTPEEVGYGYFLLPDEPSAGPPVTTPKTSPIQSGSIEITP